MIHKARDLEIFDSSSSLTRWQFWGADHRVTHVHLTFGTVKQYRSAHGVTTFDELQIKASRT